MVATPFIEEAGGFPLRTYKTQLINVVAYDVPALQEADVIGLAVLPGVGGSPGYSYERWFRLGFKGPFTTIRDIFFWMPGLALTDGWQLLYGTTDTYRAPSNQPSDIAVNPCPTGAASLDAGPVTPGNASNWVVLQAMVTAETGDPLALDFRFSFSED